MELGRAVGKGEGRVPAKVAGLALGRAQRIIGEDLGLLSENNVRFGVFEHRPFQRLPRICGLRN